MRNFLQNNKKGAQGPVTYLATVTDISEDRAWLYADHVLQKNRWETIDEGVKFVWRHPPVDLRDGTLWSFYEGSASDPHRVENDDSSPADAEGSLVRTVREGNDGPQPVSEVRFRTKPALAATKGKEVPGKARDPLSQKIYENFEALDLIRQEYFADGTDVATHGPLFVSVPDQFHIGPLFLNQSKDGRWRCNENASVELYSPLGNNKYQKIIVAGKERYALLPRTYSPSPLGRLDLRSDEAILREWLTEFAEGSPSTRSTLEKIDEVLRQGAVPSLSQFGELRFQTALRQVQADAPILDRVRQIVLTSAPVRAMQEQAVEKVQTAALAEAQEELRKLREEEVLLSRQAEAAKVLLEQIQEQTRQATLAEATAAEERTTRLAAQITEVIAAAVRQMPLPPPPVMPISYKEIQRKRELRAYASLTGLRSPADFREVCKNLHRRFHKWDLSLPDLISAQLTASWLCGLAPVIAGASASLFIRLAAAVLTGGRLHIEETLQTATEVSDLFGRPHPASGAYLPQPGGLADLLLDEGDTERLHLIAFYGFNRCDADGVFLPLMDSYQGAWNDGGWRLPLLHPYSVSADDPYRSLAFAAWPRNFLPMFVYSPSVTALPLSSAFWTHAALIVAEDGESGFPDPVGDVSMADWTRMRTDAQISAAATPLPMAARYSEALKACGTSAELSAQMAHEALALPRKVLIGEDISQEHEAQAGRIRRGLFGVG